MTVVTPKFGMGASVLRVEDQAFITGKGRYTDDIAPEACCTALCCARRSPRPASASARSKRPSPRPACIWC